jgi:hypothetical protein
MIQQGKHFAAFSARSSVFSPQMFPQLLITTTMNRLKIPAKNDCHNRRHSSAEREASENQNICANI